MKSKINFVAGVFSGLVVAFSLYVNFVLGAVVMSSFATVNVMFVLFNNYYCAYFCIKEQKEAKQVLNV